jgi:transcriptional regulator with XRE-family HTH domain
MLTGTQAEGQKIRELRSAKGWSLQKLANATGTTRSYISRVERGLLSLRMKTRAAIADALGTKTTALLQENGLISEADIVGYELCSAIRGIGIGDLLILKYGQRGMEMVEGVKAMLEGKHIDTMAAERRAENGSNKGGWKVKDLRITQGMSVKELARATGYSRSNIQLIEQGDRPVRNIALPAFAQALGTTTIELLKASELIEEGAGEYSVDNWDRIQEEIMSLELVQLLTIKYGHQGAALSEGIRMMIERDVNIAPNNSNALQPAPNKTDSAREPLTPSQREGRKIRELRETQGLALLNLVNNTGYSMAFLCEVERGKQNIGNEARAVIAHALNTAVADLLMVRGVIRRTLSEEELLTAIRCVDLAEIITIKYGHQGAVLTEGIRIFLEGGQKQRTQVSSPFAPQNNEIATSTRASLTPSQAEGRRVKQLRMEQGMTQAELATASGMYRFYIGGIERGYHGMKDTTRVAIAQALGVNVAVLLDARREGIEGATIETKTVESLKVKSTYIDRKDAGADSLSPAQREGKKIKELREARGLQRSQLAAAAGLTHDYIGNVERGERSLSSETRAIIAIMLGTTVAELLKARGLIDEASITAAELHAAIESMTLSDLFALKYGQRGVELADSVEALLGAWAAYMQAYR